MISNKYDAPVWVLIGLAAVAMVFCAGCATPKEMLQSFRAEAGHTHENQDFGKREGESDGWYLGGSWAPFKTEPTTTIIVYATHAAAEAGLPPGEVAVPVGPK